MNPSGEQTPISMGQILASTKKAFCLEQEQSTTQYVENPFNAGTIPTEKGEKIKVIQLRNNGVNT